MFHLKEGRRIVWVFDETMEKPKPGDMGRFRYDDEALVSYQYEYPPHSNLCFRWLYRRETILKVDFISVLIVFSTLIRRLEMWARKGLRGKHFRPENSPQ